MVISASMDVGRLEEAILDLLRALDSNLESALDRVLDEIAQEIKRTKRYTDRSGNLVESTQSAGSTGVFTAGTLAGAVGFGAVSESGFPYGIALEFGTTDGRIQEGVWMFARESRDRVLNSTDAFDRALTKSLRDAGFGVSA